MCTGAIAQAPITRKREFHADTRWATDGGGLTR
jgi:hypothetical protein